MLRWVLVSLVVACGGGGGGRPREVSKIKYTSTSCEGTDCAIAPESSTNGFALPDEERPPLEPSLITQPLPEPTCNLVAEALVSLELGNYADAEERAPKVAVEERRCVAMKLSREDRQCVVDSYDRASTAYCVPALFPKDQQPTPVSAARCNKVAKTMMTTLDAQLRQQPIPDQRVWERQLLAAIEACRADRWNEAMAQCAEYYVPMHAQQCAYVQPSGMWKRLEHRLAKART